MHAPFNTKPQALLAITKHHATELFKKEQTGSCLTMPYQTLGFLASYRVVL